MTEAKKDELLSVEKVTRVEVIDHHVTGDGRVFVIKDERLAGNVQLALQDDGRTLKVSI